MSWSVPPWPPGQFEVLAAEEIAGGQDLRPVLQLEGDMMHDRALASHEVHGVVVRTAAHKGKPVFDPVRDTKSQNLAVEVGEFFRIIDAERQMPELKRTNSGDSRVLGDWGLLGEHFKYRALGILEAQHSRHARHCVVALFRLDPFGLQPLADISDVGRRVDLEGYTSAARLAAFLNAHGDVAHLGGEKGGSVLTAGFLKAHHLREIIDLPLEIGRLQRHVAHPLDLDHACLQFRVEGANISRPQQDMEGDPRLKLASGVPMSAITPK